MGRSRGSLTARGGQTSLGYGVVYDDRGRLLQRRRIRRSVRGRTRAEVIRKPAALRAPRKVAGYLLIALAALRATARPVRSAPPRRLASRVGSLLPYPPVAAALAVSVGERMLTGSISVFTFWTVFAVVGLVPGVRLDHLTRPVSGRRLQ
jgi:hypothetical protein